eukprot:TRINITY_DN64644_c0_g1_i1.p1 TRINITY_DN64644_c0_g1~~TRINITY_DN64644_c0_g1_i1.p1  ORF type:complete len:159 (-),score=31.58 TRINITY_DN64644_c0_g1_i1:151-582(-)
MCHGAAGCCLIVREACTDAETLPKLEPETIMPQVLSGKRSRSTHRDTLSRKRPVQDLRVDGKRKPSMTQHRARAFLSELMNLAEALQCNRFRRSDFHELLCRYGFDGDDSGAVLAIQSLTDHLEVPQACMTRIVQVFLAAQAC